MKKKFFYGWMSVLMLIFVMTLTVCGGKKEATEQPGQTEAITGAETEDGEKPEPVTAQARPGDFGYIRNNDKTGVIITYMRPQASTVVIPDTLDGLPVVGFWTNVFKEYKSLRSVTIPATVTAIPEEAFRDCTALTEVTLRKGLTSISNGAFRGCTALTKINLPEGVTTIDINAFNNCTALAKIDLPKGLTTIGSFAFGNCAALTEVTLPEGLTTIGNRAFINCRNLSRLNVPASLTSFPLFIESYNSRSGKSWAFDNCHKLPLSVRDQLVAKGYDGSGF